MLQDSNPDLAGEINQVAQGLQPEPSMVPGTNNMVNEGNMNPNIDQKYVKPMAGKTEMHRITLNIEVPENTEETLLVNSILEKMGKLSEQGFRLKGYSFDERTQGKN